MFNKIEDLSLKLYLTMYLIRETEEKIRKHYNENEMKTPMHLCVGSEAIISGVINALHKEDHVYGTYRSHGLYLAKTSETDKFFAELYGKETGVFKGKGGSMHLFSPEHGLMGVSAVVGTTIPLALGDAFVNKKKGRVAAVFFGDGAIDEGVFWESINFACLKKLPVLFVCEDNNLAIHTKAEQRHGYEDITKIIKNFKCNVFKSESTDVEEIYRITKQMLIKIKKYSQPSFLHLKYYRYYEHVGINKDFSAGYRSEEEFRNWLERDPLKIQRKRLLKTYSEKQIQEIENKIRIQINKSLNKAKKDNFPKPSVAFEDVYA